MTRQQTVWFSALFLIASVTGLSLPFATTANAHERTIDATYNVTSATELSIESGVGTVTFERHEGSTLEVELQISESDVSFFDDANIEQVELVAKQTGNRLDLRVPEQDNIQLDWLIRLPQIAAIDLELGVGEISGRLDAADMDVELGVGAIELEIVGDIADVKTDVGIGDVKISGGDSSSNERYFISASGEAKGQGRARLNMDVGIGEIRIEIKE
ncbi:hypothetical protein PSI9734_00354 [Pseudidiomarina piscicola]|uniref:Adhesin domain-containing protein n=1 Tax=Pseudidiomarina piscicola TaxID=2614830 RepID=A0A6S6WQ12_9GAMM|nr:hypothetical protein [Pseudidiomarina piscicola]CAB0149774.1 hypothetical protein PSI9734_00354 [Pseudidiomarina piscicola]VZT39222.1 hypothetical protein PSI9734_00354 [Pseudomonas aeruginosa]